MVQIVTKANLPAMERLGLAAEYYPDYRNERIQMHGIDVMLFSVVLSGRGIHYQQQERWREEGCSVTVTRCGETHSIVSLPGEKMRIVNIYLDNRRFLMPELPEELAEAVTAFLPPAAIRPGRRNPLVRITFPESGVIEFLATGLVRELNESRPGMDQAALDYFRLFLVECGRRAIQGGLTLGAYSCAGDRRVDQLCRFLNATYPRRHTLEELAAMSRWQKNYLCRRFREYTGMTIFAYLHDLRIRNAVRLLSHSGKTIAEIAECCGFSDVNYFNRIFRRLTGSSPAQYRSRRTPPPLSACPDNQSPGKPGGRWTK